MVSVLDGTLLNYENATSHVITVRSTSADTSFTTANYTINLTDVNESAISAISDSNAAADTVLENATVGTVVGITALATDADGTDTDTYSLDDKRGGDLRSMRCDGCCNGRWSDRSRGGCELRYYDTGNVTDSSTSTSTRTITIGDVDEFDTVFCDR